MTHLLIDETTHRVLGAYAAAPTPRPGQRVEACEDFPTFKAARPRGTRFYKAPEAELRAETDGERLVRTPLRDRLKAFFYSLPPAALADPDVWNLHGAINNVLASSAPAALQAQVVAAMITAADIPAINDHRAAALALLD